MTETIHIPSKYKELAERLARRETSVVLKPVFKTYMDLMVFAAMIGYWLGEKDEVKGKEKGPEVYSEVFENNDRDGVAYLLALHDFQDGDILRENRDSECWQVIEGYAARGFRQIEDWLTDSATDIDGVSTLLNRMKENFGDQAEEGQRLTPEIE